MHSLAATLTFLNDMLIHADENALHLLSCYNQSSFVKLKMNVGAEKSTELLDINDCYCMVKGIKVVKRSCCSF